MDAKTDTITYRQVPPERIIEFFTDVKQQAENNKEIHDAFADHWTEIADHKDILKLDPDIKRYFYLLEHKKIVVVSAREGEKLVGYIIIFVSPHMHYQTVLFALEDIHYVLPEYRGRGIFKEILRTAEQVLTGMGVKFSTLRTKFKSDHGALFEELGYVPIEAIYMKRLG
jgi:GNAT superfamily N-acetyltransferase